MISQGKYIINYSKYRPSYIKGLIFYFSYYQYIIKCPELKTEVTRKDNDFYFLRDKLKKLYPATIVRFYIYFLLDTPITSKISF